MNIKQELANHIKNIFGWQTNRKLIIFSVDDYGNVRLDSKNAYDNLSKLKIPFNSHFDRFDTLETREDLEALFDVLSSVKDKYGNPAVFTPFALPCNINFEEMAENNYQEYKYELLPDTYVKLSKNNPKAYSNTWELWQEGIKKKLIRPQFHGREHFNLGVFNDLLEKRNENLLQVLRQNSYVSIPEHANYRQGWTAAYSFDKFSETDLFLENIKDGLSRFEEVFGYKASVFTPPAQQFPLHLEAELMDLGLTHIDQSRKSKRHLGDGKYKLEKHSLGRGLNNNDIVRNVVFEPTTTQHFNWVNFTFKQIEAAFRMNKPANISSHRVNFCGHIDTENREKGLKALQELLNKIVKRWPEVEFISADQLGVIITNTTNK
jgi:hypothetical protein